MHNPPPHAPAHAVYGPSFAAVAVASPQRHNTVAASERVYAMMRQLACGNNKYDDFNLISINECTAGGARRRRCAPRAATILAVVVVVVVYAHAVGKTSGFLAHPGGDGGASVHTICSRQSCVGCKVYWKFAPAPGRSQCAAKVSRLMLEFKPQFVLMNLNRFL